MLKSSIKLDKANPEHKRNCTKLHVVKYAQKINKT